MQPAIPDALRLRDDDGGDDDVRSRCAALRRVYVCVCPCADVGVLIFIEHKGRALGVQSGCIEWVILCSVVSNVKK